MKKAKVILNFSCQTRMNDFRANNLTKNINHPFSKITQQNLEIPSKTSTIKSSKTIKMKSDLNLMGVKKQDDPFTSLDSLSEFDLNQNSVNESTLNFDINIKNETQFNEFDEPEIQKREYGSDENFEFLESEALPVDFVNQFSESNYDIIIEKTGSLIDSKRTEKVNFEFWTNIKFNFKSIAKNPNFDDYFPNKQVLATLDSNFFKQTNGLKKMLEIVNSEVDSNSCVLYLRFVDILFDNIDQHNDSYKNIVCAFVQKLTMGFKSLILTHIDQIGDLMEKHIQLFEIRNLNDFFRQYASFLKAEFATGNIQVFKSQLKFYLKSMKLAPNGFKFLRSFKAAMIDEQTLLFKNEDLINLKNELISENRYIELFAFVMTQEETDHVFLTKEFYHSMDEEIKEVFHKSFMSAPIEFQLIYFNFDRYSELLNRQIYETVLKLQEKPKMLMSILQIISALNLIRETDEQESPISIKQTALSICGFLMDNIAKSNRILNKNAIPSKLDEMTLFYTTNFFGLMNLLKFNSRKDNIVNNRYKQLINTMIENSRFFGMIDHDKLNQSTNNQIFTIIDDVSQNLEFYKSFKYTLSSYSLKKRLIAESTSLANLLIVQMKENSPEKLNSIFDQIYHETLDINLKLRLMVQFLLKSSRKNYYVKELNLILQMVDLKDLYLIRISKILYETDESMLSMQNLKKVEEYLKINPGFKKLLEKVEKKIQSHMIKLNRSSQ